MREAEKCIQKNDLNGASVAIAKAEQLRYEENKWQRRIQHDVPRLSQSLAAEAEADMKSGKHDAAQIASHRAQQLLTLREGR